MSSATIYDVAKTAGVSIATVSRVLNTPQQVNEATQQRVLAAIDQLNFVPKAEATARARKNYGRIGVLAPFFTRPSFVQRMRGVANALLDAPYELVIYSADSHEHCRSHLASLPVARRIDGLILMSLRIEEGVTQRLLHHNLPTVLIETHSDQFSSVAIDNEAGGRLAAEYLLQKGHSCLAFVGGDEEVSGFTVRTTELRYAGFQKALAQAGNPLTEPYICFIPYGLEQARQLAHRLFELPVPPTAIFAATDVLAMGVLKAARERGLNVPAQVAIIGFDDLEMAEYIGLTTIRQALDESGRVAAELLLARLAEPTRPIQQVRLPLTVIARETA